MSFLSSVVNRVVSTAGNAFGNAVGDVVGNAVGNTITRAAESVAFPVAGIAQGVIDTARRGIGDWLAGGLDALRNGAASTLDAALTLLKRSGLGPQLMFNAAGGAASLLGQPADQVADNPLLARARPMVEAVASVLANADPDVARQLTTVMLNSLAGARTPEELNQSLNSLINTIGLSPRDLAAGLVSLKQSGKITDEQFEQMIQALMQQTAGQNAKLNESIANGAAPAQAAPPAAPAAGAADHGPSIKVDGPGGFLWKPVSDSDGRLAVLAPPSLAGRVASCVVKDTDGNVIERGRFTGNGNGDRDHFRFTRQGSAYPAGCTVEFQLKDGTTKSYTIKDPAMRND